jgi:hypothetical protein
MQTFAGGQSDEQFVETVRQKLERRRHFAALFALAGLGLIAACILLIYYVRDQVAPEFALAQMNTWRVLLFSSIGIGLLAGMVLVTAFRLLEEALSGFAAVRMARLLVEYHDQLRKEHPPTPDGQAATSESADR